MRPELTSNQAILTLSGVSKSFPGVKALSDVQLQLYPGQVMALVGENGAGKSTDEWAGLLPDNAEITGLSG